MIMDPRVHFVTFENTWMAAQCKQASGEQNEGNYNPCCKFGTNISFAKRCFGQTNMERLGFWLFEIARRARAETSGNAKEPEKNHIAFRNLLRNKTWRVLIEFSELVAPTLDFKVCTMVMTSTDRDP